MLLIHQRNLHTFLLTLLPHEDDVDDLLQQVCLALWQKKDSYAPDRPFLPWAYAFARNHALKYLQQQSRDRQVAVFHGGLLERLAVAREAGFGTMVLDTMPSRMGSAVAMYEKLGFARRAPYYDTPIAETIFLERSL